MIGDKPLKDISREDIIGYREHWVDRVREEGVSANSANRDISSLCAVLRRVDEYLDLRLDLPLSGIRLKGGKSKERPPFSVEWIRSKILAPGALDGLNSEARAIVLGMVNTGYRPSEACGLLPVA